MYSVLDITFWFGDHAPPMPLKHPTETILVFLLGLVIAVTGMLVATLPALPAGGVPFSILLGLTVLYPLALMPLFKSRRADDWFRLLHWFPAAMVMVWFLIELGSLYLREFALILEFLVWGWMLPLVLLGFILIVLFCLHVIRRWLTRLILLLVAFIPFAAGAMMSEGGFHFERQVASALWQGEWWQYFGSGTALPARYQHIAFDPAPGKNLQPSSNPSEEAWREQLRNSEGRSSSASSRMMVTQTNSLPSHPEWSSASSRPGTLPTSGPVMSVFLLTFVGLYSGVLHDRARRRV